MCVRTGALRLIVVCALALPLPAGVVFLGARGERGYICGMGVRQAFQGRGIGELLMREVLRNAQSIDGWIL